MGFDGRSRQPLITTEQRKFEQEPAAVVWHHFRPGIIDFVRKFFRYGKGCRMQAETHAQDLREPDPARGGGAWDAGFNPGTVRWHVGRFAWVDEVAGGNHVRFLTIPAWLPAALFAALPASPLYRRTRRRHQSGQCASCGYNLTGNVSGVCPEMFSVL